MTDAITKDMKVDRTHTRRGRGRCDGSRPAWLAGPMAVCVLGFFLLASVIMEPFTAIAQPEPAAAQPGTAEEADRQALALNQAGRYAEALSLLRRAAELAEAEFGPDAPATGTRWVALAEQYRFLGRLAEAEPPCRRALAIAEAAFGPDHPEVAARLDALGDLLQDQGRYAEAEPQYRRALAIAEAALGPDQQLTIVTVNSLGKLLYA